MGNVLESITFVHLREHTVDIVCVLAIWKRWLQWCWYYISVFHLKA